MSTEKSPLNPEQRSYSRKAIAIGITVCVAISAGGYFVGIAPALAGLVERRGQERELADRKTRSAELATELRDTRQRLVAANKELAELPLRLEPASAVNRRINLLAGVAGEAKVTLNEIQPQSAVDGQHYQTVPIRVVGAGSYPACAAFLHALRERFPDTTVQSFDLQNAAPSRDANVATFRMELAWHTSPAGK
ncbi:type 4a pilus biogenesis protein PilO [Humisphaera borealis]|uniref:Type 4a pilus biogenesis protein PilO n=1 Tax=Humisphaera borealis TaxID=2807512 RepID=A0A7M2X2Z5_9BACT|nr:type 4a pilus biogenesis protein PilO [Humisphaera borealis]QOV92044.1 type 4a pilus biogenesis protein PilO [Humisphaera borealis]